MTPRARRERGQKTCSWMSEMALSAGKSRPDHVSESLQLGLRHGIAAGEVVGREQEDVLDVSFLLRLQEALGAPLRRTEQAERVGDALSLILGNRRRVVRLGEIEAGFRQ